MSHLAIVGLAFVVVMVGPLVLEPSDREGVSSGTTVLSVSANDEMSFYTLRAQEVQQYRGGEVITHVVEEGEDIDAVAARYNLKPETIIWENNLADKPTLKTGQELRILPIDGVRHKVVKGETIYTIAKKYGLEESQTQMIVDYPFNEFLNDETFELAVGQYLIVPYGVKPKTASGSKYGSNYARTTVMMTPDAGAVSGSGQFVWPASGGISQGYIPGIHRAIDIANRSLPPILAADSGTVVAAGWDSSGYGNRVVIDHGNGFVTLYAHMSAISVTAGQTVGKGNQIGIMGSTGRSTGPHLHFEVRNGGGLLNPLQYL